jgi:hypothetical protein
MAKSRRTHRKGHRKSHRKGHRKSRRNTRRNRRNTRRNNLMGGRRGIFGTLYSPVSHLLGAAGNATGAVTNTTRNVVRRGLGGVNKVGRSVTGHANKAISNFGKGLGSRRRRN